MRIIESIYHGSLAHSSWLMETDEISWVLEKDYKNGQLNMIHIEFYRQRCCAMMFNMSFTNLNVTIKYHSLLLQLTWLSHTAQVLLGYE